MGKIEWITKWIISYNYQLKQDLMHALHKKNPNYEKIARKKTNLGEKKEQTSDTVKPNLLQQNWAVDPIGKAIRHRVPRTSR